MADQPQAGGLAQPSHQLLLEQRQHLVRSVRRGQPASQLSNGGPAPNLLYRHRPVTQLGRGHRQERRQPPRLEVHADGPGPEWVAELQRAGGHGDHAAVGVLGRLDVGAGADAERRCCRPWRYLPVRAGGRDLPGPRIAGGWDGRIGV